MSLYPMCSLLRSDNADSQKYCRKPACLAGGLAPIALAGVTLSFAANPAQALTLFSGNYAPANWTQVVAGDAAFAAMVCKPGAELWMLDRLLSSWRLRRLRMRYIPETDPLKALLSQAPPKGIHRCRLGRTAGDSTNDLVLVRSPARGHATVHSGGP
jgi:hypothetical protein